MRALCVFCIDLGGPQLNVSAVSFSAWHLWRHQFNLINDIWNYDWYPTLNVDLI